MTQLSEAIARYHKILESEPYRDMGWAATLVQRMEESGLVVSARPVCPVLRPHFLSARQYTSLTKASETLISSIDRIKQMALLTPALQARMEMLPAEKMLAAIDPGYRYLSVASLLETYVNNGTLRFMECVSDAPMGLAYGEILTNLFLETGPLKEFKKKFALTKLPGSKSLLTAMLRAYKEFGGKKTPNIAIVELKQPFQTIESAEYHLLAEVFRKQGYAAEVVNLDQLEYKNGILKRGDFQIDLVYRCVKVQEFLVRYDLTHPLVRAYKDHAICMVNSFRAELARKKAIFDLLTDDSINQAFPAAERKVIRDSIPWTRVVTTNSTSFQDKQVDLVDFIHKNRETLVLRPNDEVTDQHEYRGWETDDAGWDRALRTALRNPYVVQQRTEPFIAPFPVYQWGSMEMKNLRVDVHPHTLLGKVQGCSSWISAVDGGRFSTLQGVAPTFVLA
ncbi:MAG TPA: hypothetical protein VM120_16760 [Bryobacteraceae bacterium]|nr:hypothetical protein [Bryobacteraceae bacterium]